MFCHYRLRCQEHDLLLFDLVLEVFTLLPFLELTLFRRATSPPDVLRIGQFLHFSQPQSFIKYSRQALVFM